MKRIILFKVFILITISGIAQNNQMSVGLIGSPDFYNYNFKTEDKPPFFEYKSIPGFRIGLRYQYNCTNALFLRTGLTYIKQGYSLEYHYRAIDPNDPFIPRQSNLSVSYMDIPLILGYKLIDFGKLKFTPSLGFDFGICVNKTENTIYENNSEQKSDALSKDISYTLITGNVNLGFEYHLNEKIFISFDPFISKSLNNTNESLFTSGYLSFGGLLGLNYKL